MKKIILGITTIAIALIIFGCGKTAAGSGGGSSGGGGGGSGSIVITPFSGELNISGKVSDDDNTESLSAAVMTALGSASYKVYEFTNKELIVVTSGNTTAEGNYSVSSLNAQKLYKIEVEKDNKKLQTFAYGEGNKSFDITPRVSAVFSSIMEGLTTFGVFNTGINAAYYADYIDKARAALISYYQANSLPAADDAGYIASVREAFNTISSDPSVRASYDALINKAYVQHMDTRELPAKIEDAENDTDASRESLLVFTPDIKSYELGKDGDNINITINFFNPVPPNPGAEWGRNGFDSSKTRVAGFRFEIKTLNNWFGIGAETIKKPLTVNLYSDSDQWKAESPFHLNNTDTITPAWSDGNKTVTITIAPPKNRVGFQSGSNHHQTCQRDWEAIINYPEALYAALDIIYNGDDDKDPFNWFEWTYIDTVPLAKIKL
jgi:hypothetical protein